MLDQLTEIVGNTIGTIFGSRSVKYIKRALPIVEQINELEPKYAKLTDAALALETERFRAEIDKIRAEDPEAEKKGKIERYLDKILPEAFALVRESGKRTLGMRHFDVQLIGGWVLHKGMISEMVTGEGKTLVATLPSYLNALVRRPGEYAQVYIVTVNDYLARRDAEWNRPLFELLGMTCGAIQSAMDSYERHPVYGSDIVYGVNNEFGFDYLRDNMKMEIERQVQRGRRFAIVDEVDSILIDEARTPLIISGSPDDCSEKYKAAASLAAHLKPVSQEEKDRVDDLRLKGIFEDPVEGHYTVDEKDHTVTLTHAGIRECERFLGIENIYKGTNMDWPHFIDNALKAKELYKKDVHYVVAEGREGRTEVIIVDEFTGRMMHGRRWSDGLHQAVEAKEGLDIEGENQTLATITLQNYFKLFRKVAGMTGTALTEAREFGRTYKLEVVSIPTNKPMRRLNFPDVIYGTEKEKWEALCLEIEDVHATGRPILVGTTSIEKSELLAGMLERRGYRNKFSVLNAKQHAREAEIVARAGELGAITIATNMAGRGTDIILRSFTPEQLLAHWTSLNLAPKNFDLNRPHEELTKHLIGYWAKFFLEPKVFDETPQERRLEALEKRWAELGRSPLRWAANVRDLGGLHIIGTERHEARRIDNQLRGRAGRQGDPGSSRFFLSLDDDLMRVFARDWVKRFLRASGMKDGVPLESGMVSRAIEKAQRRVEEHHFGVRKRLLEYDEVMNKQRTLIYGLRQQVLESRDLRAVMLGWIEDTAVLAAEREMKGQDRLPVAGAAVLSAWARKLSNLEISPDDLTELNQKAVEDKLIDRLTAHYAAREDELGEGTFAKVERLHYTAEERKLPPAELAAAVRKKLSQIVGVEEKEINFGEADVTAGLLPSAAEKKITLPLMRMIEHDVMLGQIDSNWVEHLRNMDILRDGIYLRGYAQKDPKREYEREGYGMFMDMFGALKERAGEAVFRVQVDEKGGRRELQSVYNEDAAQTQKAEAQSAFDGKAQQVAAKSEHGGADLKPTETIRREQPHVAPNDPCPCGSGKKFKKCHLRSGGWQPKGKDGPPTTPGAAVQESKKKTRIGG
jgi:preprotein translocase subunit SecA